MRGTEMTLYEMTQAGLQLYALLSADEIDEQTVTDTLEAMGVADKLEDYCKVIRQFQADAAAYKAEADRLSEKRKRAENAVARLKAAVKSYMDAVGTEKVQAGVFDIKVSHSRAVSIIDESVIPLQYRTPQPDKIDKAELRRALMSGEEIAGVELTVNENISIK